MPRSERLPEDLFQQPEGYSATHEPVHLEIVESDSVARAKAVATLADRIKELNVSIADGTLEKGVAKIHVELLLSELNTIREDWQKSSGDNNEADDRATRALLSALVEELRATRKQVMHWTERIGRRLLAPMVGLGLLGGAALFMWKKGEFSQARDQFSELRKQGTEYEAPTVPDHLMVMAEKENGELLDTTDLLMSFKRHIVEKFKKDPNHPPKEDNETDESAAISQQGLDLAFAEEETGMLGVYLKFGDQINSRIFKNFLEVYGKSLAKRLGISVSDLETMREIFQTGVYKDPGSFGSTGTSSIFYVSDSDTALRFKDNREWYHQEFANVVQFLERMVPQIMAASPEIRADLKKNIADYLKAEFHVRALRERIKRAITQNLHWELEGVADSYGNKQPSLFERIDQWEDKRDQAIAAWYGAVGETNENAPWESKLASLGAGLQGWADIRITTLAVVEAELDKGVFRGEPDERLRFVEEHDREFLGRKRAFIELIGPAPEDPLIAQAN